MLINGSNIKKSFAERILFENVSFNVEDYEKIGFIGNNGVGKSTFFKILMGKENIDEGDIFKSKDLAIGYLDQYSCADSKKTIFDEICTVFSRVIEIEKELTDIQTEIDMGSSNLDILIKRQHSLNEEFSRLDGFYYKSVIKSTLLGLGFSEDDFSVTVDKLSGGQKTRVELAKILLSDANLLLLDEPTNHLDIKSVEWLEGFLKGYKKAFIVISHDRYFLDSVTNRTFELSSRKLYSVKGNYTEYCKVREIEKKTIERENKNVQREIDRLNGVIEQQRRWNRERNIKTAESKLKVVEKLEESLVAEDDPTLSMSFNFKAYQGGGNDVLTVTNLSKSFDKNKLFSDISFEIHKGEKIFLLGSNGCGKTTLLKIIMQQLSQDSGSFKIGEDIHIGYYDQIQESLSLDRTVIDEVWDSYPKMTQTEIRNALASFLFRGEDVYKIISTLSGGERARVQLVKLILGKVNFLIMDEPTNHLDIESREALENALVEYDTTMLLVSHDRFFINKLADKIIYMNDESIDIINGGYDDYMKKLYTPDIEKQEKQPKKENDYFTQKKKEAEKRKIRNRNTKLEEQIQVLMNEISNLEDLLSTSEVATDYVRATELSNSLNTKNDDLANVMEEWEEIQHIMEEDCE